MRPASSAERGFTLIEVLVSILIFSIGVLGMVAMQARAVQTGTDSQDRNHAAALANELAGNMWAVHTGDVTNPLLTNYYTNTWLPEVAAALPGGVGSATLSTTGTTAGVTTIQINWTPTSRTTNNPAQYLTELVIQ
jgi:type IV pilus assembly protein PilV